MEEKIQKGEDKKRGETGVTMVQHRLYLPSELSFPDQIEKERCIICGRETERFLESFIPKIAGLEKENIPICKGCQDNTRFSKIVEEVEKYKERREGQEIGRTIALELKKKGYEYYRRQDVQGAEIRFFIKGRRLVQVIVEEETDEDILESIKGGK